MKKLFAAVLTVLCFLSLSGCGKNTSAASTPSSQASSASQSSSADSKKTADSEKESVDKLIDTMTLEEKVGQLFFVCCPSSSACKDVQTYHLGGYILFGRDFQNKTADEIIQTIAAYQKAAGKISLLIGTDEEGGTVVRISSNPKLRVQKFLSPQQAFAKGGIQEVTRETEEKDRLLKALGINVNFAPIADVSTNNKDFIYSRSFGQNASATSDYIKHVVSQMNTNNMGSVLKHFPGYGNNRDTHTGIATDLRPMNTFETSDFLPFQAGIKTSDGKTAVLVSHNIMTAADAKLPASLSSAVHTILRKKLKFRGVVITDDLAMGAVQAYAKNGNIAVMALKAGNDMVLTTDYRTQIPSVLAAVKSGDLKEKTINTACRRVLNWKIKLGLISSD